MLDVLAGPQCGAGSQQLLPSNPEWSKQTLLNKNKNKGIMKETTFPLIWLICFNDRNENMLVCCWFSGHNPRTPIIEREWKLNCGRLALGLVRFGYY